MAVNSHRALVFDSAKKRTARLQDGTSDFPMQVVAEHSRFLKRNSSAITALTSTSGRAAVSGNLLRELFVFVATGRPAVFLDQRSRKSIERRLTSAAMTRHDERYWEHRLDGVRACQRGASARIAHLSAALQERHDYPKLGSMRRWGVQRWEALFKKLGIDRREAHTFLAIVVGRSDLMPQGVAYERVYQRLGFNLDKSGRLREGAIFPRDRSALGIALGKLAFGTCTENVQPGTEACRACPLTRFCLAGREVLRTTPSGPTFVDVFAGAGGFGLGFRQAGFRELAAIEKCKQAVDTLYYNTPEMNWTTILRKDVRRLGPLARTLEGIGPVDVLLGGPPCQPFSMIRRHTRPDRRHPQRFLFKTFIRMAEALKPRIVIMENVPGLLNAADGVHIKRILSQFSDTGYHAEYRLLNAADFGVPQVRHRVVFVAVRRDAGPNPEGQIRRFWVDLEASKVKRKRTVGEAIRGLPKIRAGQGSLVVRLDGRGRRSRFAREMMRGTSRSFNHEARAHNERDIRIFKKLRRGETAMWLERRSPGIIPYSLEAFPDKYRKLRGGTPAPTIPAHLHRDANSFVHPDIPRGITCREAARLQSFPDSYFFMGGFGPAFIQIGNAVPPKFAALVARSIRELVETPSSKQSAAPPPRDHSQHHIPRSPAPSSPSFAAPS